MSQVKATIYIKSDRNVEVTKPDVTLGDIFQVECSNPVILAKVKTLKLFHFHSADKKVSRTVLSVVFLTFAGAAFSIMAFNNDVDTAKLFRQIYTLLTGKVSDGFTVLEFTYCIGLIMGILVFFNHFGKKRFSADPTPIEVEMRTYENEIQSTLIEAYSRKEKEIDVGTTDHTAGHSGPHRT